MSLLRFLFGAVRFTVVWLLVLGATAWTFGALWFDLPDPTLRAPAAIGFAIFALAALVFVWPRWHSQLALVITAGLVVAWWFTLQPRNDRQWQPDVAQMPWADVDGDLVTLHNVRNCDYRSNDDFTVRWETRKMRLSQLTGLDIALGYWGSAWMAHPILSFQFADAPPVAMSIEVRKEVGEPHSSLRGLFRQYELIYIAADERDVLRVRTNFREGESLYLYRTKLSPEDARIRFLEYLETMNAMRNQARWYNVLTTNCTTAIRAQHDVSHRMPFDWRLLLNGKMDELLYDFGMLATDGLPFAELKEKALANPAGLAAGKAPDFSKRIREGRPGFGAPPAN
jgi:hypothetical protein